jgi:prepilin-type N-terminal cleavage/methylation domain-containing protein
MQVSNIRNPKSEIRNLRPGFTLVEMLVAVALVVLMMTLFATIFQIATGAMSTQKGLAENDQRVRLVLNRLRNDLNGIKNDPNDPNRPYRTFRLVVPYAADETSTSNFNPTDRIGYIYISEGNPNDDTDDRIQLTVQFPATGLDQFYGKAALLFPDSTANPKYGVNSPNPGAGYPPAGSAAIPIPPGSGYWPNQPDFDDIFGIANQVGNSPFAEVSYFLRNGTLYRRVMLIRDPNGISPTPQDGTPTDTSGNILNLGTYTNGVRGFWNDFDYSAAFDSLDNLAQPFRFHGTGTLLDGLGPTGTGLPNPFILGNPAYRFGFDSSTVLNAAKTAQIPSTTYGQPRDYVTTAAGTTYYIGAFTHAETSDLAFGYPASITSVGGSSPMSNSTKLSYDTVNGRVGVGGVNFNGPRSGEDILMTNVLKFDIKVFDPAASFGPDGKPGVAGVDDDNNGTIDDMSELGWAGSDDGAFVDLGHSGTRGFYASSNTAQVFDFSPQVNNKQAIPVPGPTNVPVTSRVKIPNPPPAVPVGGDAGVTFGKLQTYIYPNTYYNYGSGGVAPLPPFANRYDTWNPSLNLDNVSDANNNPLSDVPPYRPFNFGADGAPGAKGIDDDGNGLIDYVIDPNTGFQVPDPREIGWPNTDDQPVPLSAIQIKITFYDVTSQQIRDVTLVQSLVYTP